MSDKPKCSGNCRLCKDIGICPADHTACEDCGAELEPGEGIEVEVETADHGRRGSKMITVCEKCFETYYRYQSNVEQDF